MLHKIPKKWLHWQSQQIGNVYWNRRATS